METIVVQELLPHIDATFRTVARREARILEGFSMGGYGAARLGFKHPDLFAAVSILAGGPLDLEFQGPRATGNPAERERILQSVYGGDLGVFRAQSPWVLAEQHANRARGKTRLRLVVGERDFAASLNGAFHDHLTKLGIAHEFIMPAGIGHATLRLLEALGESNWEFYRSAWTAESPAPKP
jgi:S-formylglutathione hydrolase FrmB